MERLFREMSMKYSEFKGPGLFACPASRLSNKSNGKLQKPLIAASARPEKIVKLLRHKSCFIHNFLLQDEKSKNEGF
jgi:hypothetical protein